ncbi:MAG TPA: hypothetical protein P5218_16310, partial [Planctomycetota bacterium]|nr:hypothetical protein [Planctomycetota bacterium]
VGFWQGRRRGIALLASAGLVGAVWAFPFQPLEIAKPWSRVLQDVLWCREYPNGQFAVYGAGETDFMGRLDQRALTPPPESERLDQRMLIHSVQLLEPTRRLGSKVLLAGLLTPQRWQTLYAQGVRRVDRIGLVGGPGREAEAALFGGRMPDSVVGSWLAWEQAIEALEAGSYDLVIVPPGGPNLAANGQNGLLVAWQLVDEGLGERPDDGDDWLLCADGLQRFAAARVHGIAGDWLAPPGALRVNLGAPISLAPRRVWSSRREWERIDLARIGFWERMTRACTDPAQRTLFASLRDLQADQRHSSPFENEAQQLELTPERAEEWTQALLALPPSPFLDELAGGLARTLVGKREIEGIFRWIGQLSPALGHPYELERSLARAELESLDPNAAADRLEALDARFP